MITEAKIVSFLEDLAELEVEIDADGLEEIFTVTLGLARRHQRSAYDASYLELALRLGLPLATKDEPLRKAALELGLDIFQPA